jgi:hypothetical protein
VTALAATSEVPVEAVPEDGKLAASKPSASPAKASAILRQFPLAELEGAVLSECAMLPEGAVLPESTLLPGRTGLVGDKGNLGSRAPSARSASAHVTWPVARKVVTAGGMPM